MDIGALSRRCFIFCLTTSLHFFYEHNDQARETHHPCFASLLFDVAFRGNSLLVIIRLAIRGCPIAKSEAMPRYSTISLPRAKLGQKAPGF